MNEIKQRLPDFDKPPVIETVLGVQFNNLVEFSIPHYGLYWAEIKDDYPSFEIQPPLTPIVETYKTKISESSKVGLEILGAPEIRSWFINKSKTRQHRS